jgi:RNA polymerase sigma-70 factor (sigma-E family)
MCMDGKVVGLVVEVGGEIDEQPTRALPGDFESFYRQHADGVYRALAVMLGDVDLAQDAAAEALTRTFQHWPRVRRYDNPAGWAYRVGMNWANSRRRRRRREGYLVESSAAVADPADAAGVRADLLAAMQALAPDHREVVVLRYLLDLRQDEVARVLGVPIGTVKSRLGRGLSRLREVMET